ncbi:DUF6624 domain-containing protein [Streptomyces nogalater]|uniref:DUF6624 domain-containing protein n=1 Tax=Streptomyces nogalater TaxID=38314 RepID=A0ABW0WRZ6_STRNO
MTPALIASCYPLGSLALSGVAFYAALEPLVRDHRTSLNSRQHSHGGPDRMNHDLAAELHRRAEQDQAARRRLLKTGAADDLVLIDADNTAWLKQVIARHGWPGITLVGEQGADEAWLLAQHADRDPDFQRQALSRLQDAVEAGEALPRHLAYLTDRVLVASGEPQVYGTQYTHDPDGGDLRPHPVSDPSQLDTRRACVGLEPAAEADRRMRERYPRKAV